MSPQQVQYVSVKAGLDGEVKVGLRYLPEDAEEGLILSLSPLYARTLARDLLDRAARIAGNDETGDDDAG